VKFRVTSSISRHPVVAYVHDERLGKPAIIMPDESQAITELRTLRKKAEKSAAEIRKALLKWQESLGHGKFKQAFMAAGWTQNQVSYYLYKLPTNEIGEVQQEPVDSKAEVSQEPEEEAEEDVLPDDMPDNPLAKRREDYGQKLTALGYGRVIVQASELVEDRNEVLFVDMTFDEIEALIQALKARRIPSRKSALAKEQQVN
jgi:hypothetical protein